MVYGIAYLKEALNNLYKEHVEKLINQKAEEFQDELMVKIDREWLTLQQTVTLMLFAMLLLLAIAHFWPEPRERKYKEEKPPK